MKKIIWYLLIGVLFMISCYPYMGPGYNSNLVMIDLQDVDNETSGCGDEILRKIAIDTVDYLLDLLKNPGNNSRECVIRALGKVASPRTVRPLLEHCAAIHAKEYDMSKGITPEFMAIANESRAVMAAFKDMGGIALPELNAIFVNKEEDAKMREEIPNAYDWIDSTSTVPLLKNVIVDSTDDIKVRLKSMDPYYELSKDKTLFESMVADQNEEIRKKAKEILEKK